MHHEKKRNILTLFAIEGALLQFTGSINGFGNNLFATNLGATDSQIGLIQTIPNLVAMLFLLPLGILADKAKNTKVVPLFTLCSMTIGYILLALVPMANTSRIPLFFLAIAFTVGSTVLYNAQWQNFFGDAATIDESTSILTRRNRFMFFIGIIAPIVCGFWMGQYSNASGKLHVLQIIFIACAFVTISQALVISHIPVPAQNKKTSGFSLHSLTDSIRDIFHHKDFVLFFLPVIFFYMVWQLDWSMWYIGQVDYLGLTEAQMSVYNGVFNIGQLFAVGILSKSVLKRGADYTLTYAAISLMTCPLIMIVSSLIPTPARMISFTLLITVLNAAQCATNLCIVQILLRVAPAEHRSIAISVYTLTITFTNCIMPFLGVQLYLLLGGNYRAMIIFNIATFVLRLVAYLLLRYRCSKSK